MRSWLHATWAIHISHFLQATGWEDPATQITSSRWQFEVAELLTQQLGFTAHVDANDGMFHVDVLLELPGGYSVCTLCTSPRLTPEL